MMFYYYGCVVVDPIPISATYIYIHTDSYVGNEGISLCSPFRDNAHNSSYQSGLRKLIYPEPGKLIARTPGASIHGLKRT